MLTPTGRTGPTAGPTAGPTNGPLPDATQPQTRWGLVLLLCGCGVLGGAQFAKISVEFALLQAVYNVSAARIGFLLSTVGLMGLVFGVVAGFLAPRFGYRRLLLAGLVGGGVLSGLQALLPPLWVFWASRIPEGAAHLAIMVATPTLLIQATAPAHRTAVMGLWATVVGLAFAVEAGLERLFPAGVGPRDYLAGHAVLMVMAAGAVSYWVPHQVVEPADPNADGLAQPTPQPTPQPTAQSADPVRPRPWGSARGLLALHRTAYADIRTALPGIAFFFYAFATIALITFVPRFSGLGHAGFMTVLPLAATAGTLAAGWAARHLVVGDALVRWAYLAFGAAALALGAAALWPAPTEFLALLTLGLAGLAGGAAATLIPQLNPTAAGQARASGVLVQLGNVGSVCGPPVFAALADWGGLAGLAGLSVLTCGVALVVLWRLRLPLNRLG